MKCPCQSRDDGSVLTITLLITAIIAVVLASYLTCISNHNVSVERSQTWNQCIPVLEAGIEEAMTQIQYCGITKLSSNNWTFGNDGLYHKMRSVGNDGSYCEVSIRPVDPPVIVSAGYVPAPLSPVSRLGMIFGQIASGSASQSTPAYVRRKVLVTTRHNTYFRYAMAVKDTLKLNGNNIATDSFNSTNSTASTNGKYDVTKARDHGDVATNSGLDDALKTGNADIQGKLATGPGASVYIGKNGTVGDKNWVESGTLGIQPDHLSDSMNAEFPDVVPPAGTPTMVYPGSYLIGNKLGATNYNYVLVGYPTGEPLYMKSSSLGGKVYVSGRVALLVTDTFNFGSKDYIYLAPGASLAVYVAAPSAYLSGVVNMGSALNFQYYGLNSNTSLTFSSNAAFTGGIYAPYADFKLNGGGNNIYDFVGASLTKTVSMGGHYKFHYDEALADGPWKGYLVRSWDEIDPR